MRECQVWWTTLDDVRPEYVELLNPVEAGRRERYLRTEDQDRFTLGVAVTRLVTGALLGVPPERVPVSRDCPDCGAQHGRPVIEGGPYLSVSHSGGRVAVAFSYGGPLGVDVEAAGKPLDEGIADALLSPSETRANGSSELLVYWTRKEALLKATGDGLREPLTNVRVSGPAEPPRLLGWEGKPDLPGRITMHTLDPGPGYVACLALIDQPDTPVRELRAPADLP